VTRPTTIRAITEIPAKIPRPIGSTATVFPGTTAAFDESAAAVVVLDTLEAFAAAVEAVLEAAVEVVVSGRRPVEAEDETDVEVFAVTVETGYYSVSTMTERGREIALTWAETAPSEEEDEVGTEEELDTVTVETG
jgi:hypothetical protein